MTQSLTITPARMMNMDRLIIGIAVIFVTMLGSTTVTSLETMFLKAVKPSPVEVVQDSGKTVAAQEASKKREEEKIANEHARVEVLRNSFLMLWLIGGVIPGSAVGVVLKQVTGYKAITHATVSVCTSVPVTPYLLKRYTDCAPEECFIGGFIVAVSAWFAWEVLMLCYARIKKAATKRGIGGVVDEVRGNGK